MSKLDTALKRTGNTSKVDNFYEYLSGEIALPDLFMIGNDCLYNHGVNGKTVRRINKGKNTMGPCIRCEKLKGAKSKRKKYKSKNDKAKIHKRAMDLLEEQQHKDEGFLT